MMVAARHAVLSATCLLWGLLGGPATAQGNGDDAFASGDYARAAVLWQAEAAAGSADALFGLGLLADSGIIGPADPQQAFDYYLRAAALGLPQAQRSVGFSYDTGLGVPRDAGLALLWYSRAALRGDTEAQRSLGNLLAGADASIKNPQLARYWRVKAGQVVAPASDEVPALLSAPEITFTDRPDGGGFEVIWQAAPSANPLYQLEMLPVAAPAADYGAPVVTSDTTGSGLLLPDLDVPQDAVWRVINLAADGGDYKASDWQGTAGAAAPIGRVAFVVDASLPAMQAAVDVFTDDLRAAGYWVRVVKADQIEQQSYVSYGYATDILLADRIARYLPASGGPVKYRQETGATRPGEVVVHLAVRR